MIPFQDLGAQHRALRDELLPEITAILDSGRFVLGEPVEKFETDFAAFCGTRDAVTVNSGTSALHLALLAAGVGPGDEVITVSMTFVATVAAILYCGATPVYVDIDPDTWTMDPAALKTAITPRTKAIVPVHLHGRIADMSAIVDIARDREIVVIEDAAQAHGAERDGTCAGAFADMGCFSFYPGKNLGAAGEGGAVVTSRPDLAERMRILRDWGQAGKYNHVVQGFNYRMDALQAAILKVKLRHLPAWTEKRQEAGALYDRLLANIDVGRPAPAGRDHVYHVYAVTAANRDRLQADLTAAGIATGIHYPRPVHLQKAYADCRYPAGSLPVTEAFASTTLSLPIFPEITAEQIQTVATTLASIREKDHADAA
ncbi:DegT/DnrJ/EryC1/StrS family aminotransferase [Microbaculum sp. FT89]|uniref:DegT/DnrJ/EryC1/StrS family aminotransferase n=1 Tax=Microbaculum sp. FT89 TaxID=3447298 RepID=UPI003F532C1E